METISGVPMVTELRGKVAESLIPLYVIAAAVRVHPAHLGQMLRGRQPLPENIAMRIEEVLRGAKNPS